MAKDENFQEARIQSFLRSIYLIATGQKRAYDPLEHDEFWFEPHKWEDLNGKQS